jgi:hypothetical protein
LDDHDAAETVVGDIIEPAGMIDIGGEGAGRQG